MNVLGKVTRKNLKKNKVRTIVTIIGVILSASMITAVATLVTSLQAYLVESVIAEEGDWYLQAQGVSPQFEQTLRTDKRVERIGSMEALGYAKLQGGQNEDKPYWYVTAWDEDMFRSVPIRLISGRLPQNGQEIVVPENMAEVAGVSYKVGDTVTLALGTRLIDGEPVWQDVEMGGGVYYTEESLSDLRPETLVPASERTFKVVGICRRFSFDLEYSSSPGFTTVTVAEPQDKALRTDLFLRTHTAGQAVALNEELSNLWVIKEAADRDQIYYSELHQELLRMMGEMGNDGLELTLYLLAGILLSIILLGSVALIHNAFAISVSERSQQFGLLSSVGATRKQLRSSVLYEALFISAIGIPLGILAGIGGIGVTLYAVGDWFKGLFTDSDVVLHLSVSWEAIVAAALLGLGTILVSAWIPARRAARVTAIEAIRQSQDVKIKARQVKTSRLTRKLFGFEGEMALKNLKRSRRRYRNTVFSLAVSIVLFIGSSSFVLYATNGVERVVSNANCDVMYNSGHTFYPSLETEQAPANQPQLFRQLLGLDSLQSGALVEITELTTLLSPQELDETYYQRQQQYLENYPTVELFDEQGQLIQRVALYAMDQDAFDRYAADCGLNPQDYAGDAPTAIALREGYSYSDSGRYETHTYFNSEKPRTLSLWAEEREEDGLMLHPEHSLPIEVAGYTNQFPIGLGSDGSSNLLYLIMPRHQMEPVREWLRGLSSSADDKTLAVSGHRMVFLAEDSAKAAKDIQALLTEHNQPTDGVYDMHEQDDYNRRFLSIMKVFVYGFITLISLITVANVFNTISTNIHLRRREFAMLRSVGMSPHGFERMMRFECALYGLQALLYGLPAAALVTYVIYLALNVSIDTTLSIPWGSVLVSVGGVFLVVFITMLYATHKIRRENIIDALKTETT